MTFPDESADQHDGPSEQIIRDVRNALITLLKEALVDNRITTGVYNCADILQRCPDLVMLCLLPDSGPEHDVTIDIEHTLIEAHCWENDVRVLKVGNAGALSKILKSDKSLRKKNLAPIENEAEDMSCLLIKYPKEVENGNEWQKIEQFCNWCLFHDVQQCLNIQTPD